jgi:hypothetical protein
MIGFYVSAGLLTAEHMRRIGSALAEFLWLISHETRDGGRVLNGAPITLKRIAADLGECERTARTNLRRLEAEGYITRRRGQAGYEHCIANSKKWVKGPAENCRTDRQETAAQNGKKLPITPAESCRSNKEEVDSSRQVDKVDRTTTPKTGAHPTLQDVTLYCKERGNRVDPQQWMDHYQSNGWKVGRNPMRDWKAAVRTWEKNGVKGQDHANRAERRQNNNLAARDAVRASIVAGG